MIFGFGDELWLCKASDGIGKKREKALLSGHSKGSPWKTPVVRAMLRSDFADLRSLAVAGVVFPKPALRVEIVLPVFEQPERDIMVIIYFLYGVFTPACSHFAASHS